MKLKNCFVFWLNVTKSYLDDWCAECFEARPDPLIRLLILGCQEVITDVSRKVHGKPNAHDQAIREGIRNQF
jgi:hypothetical protein